MHQTAGTKEEVHFHPTQLEYLEKVFPEKIVVPDTTEADMRYRGGQRSVLYFIRQKVKK